jgi:hypothetical protein
MSDKSRYLIKAKEAISQVYYDEYSGLLALPFPEIKFLTSSEENYVSGQYFITIGDSWRIHLNFGKLPHSYKEFKEEVKVLTRHEIEHYQTCPYNVLTHFRMIQAILNVNSQKNKPVDDNTIRLLAPYIANQIADIVIDTKLFQKNPWETLKSEIGWIKKGSLNAFQDVSRNGKLMFLLKEALWREDLELYESSKVLRSKVSLLEEIFNQGGIDNKEMVIRKTDAYSKAFLELYELDRIDLERRGGPGGNLDENLPSKNGAKGEADTILSDPDKIKDAINQLAQETEIDDFIKILDAAGVKQLSDAEREMAWFEAQSVEEIPLYSNLTTASNDEMSYPSTWRLEDPVEELDMLLTLQSIPRVIPGISTKKWQKEHTQNKNVETKNSDLLLVIDTSGSMGDLKEEGSRLHEAVLASFGFVKYYEHKKAEVALINFSSTKKVEAWTRDYDSIKKLLLFSWGQGTEFPVKDIKSLVEIKKDKMVIIVITDGKIQNWENTFLLFKDLLHRENEIFIFIMDNNMAIDQYSKLEHLGGFVKNATSMEEIRRIVFSQLIG